MVSKETVKVRADENAFSAKRLAATAVTVAFMIGAQLVLSAVPGVEVVSLILCVFCVVFGPVSGVVAALAFALLRAIVFGFTPNVLVVYLLYYPAFALVTGWYGGLVKRAWGRRTAGSPDLQNGEKPAKKGTFLLVLMGLVALCTLATCTFTLLDDAITPIIMGFGKRSALLYFYKSLPVMATHAASVCLSLCVLFYPLWRIMEKIKRSMRV